MMTICITLNTDEITYNDILITLFTYKDFTYNNFTYNGIMYNT